MLFSLIKDFFVMALNVALTATCRRYIHVCTMSDNLTIGGLARATCNQRYSLHKLSLAAYSFKVYLIHICNYHRDIG